MKFSVGGINSFIQMACLFVLILELYAKYYTYLLSKWLFSYVIFSDDWVYTNVFSMTIFSFISDSLYSYILNTTQPWLIITGDNYFMHEEFKRFI